MPNEIESHAKYVPQLFFDVIARIIPGSIILSLYFWDAVLKNPSLMLAGTGLAASYFLGLVLDKVSDLFLTPILKRSLGFSRNPAWKKFSTIPDWKIWVWIHDSVEAERKPLLLKMMAEKICLRSMILASLFWICPVIAPLDLGCLHPLYVLLALGLLFISHLKADVAVSSHFERGVQGEKTS